jgi:hypothetical protein
MMVPAYVSATTPIATPDRIIFVLGDFQDDIWLTDLRR